jgi:hypothetical protein
MPLACWPPMRCPSSKLSRSECQPLKAMMRHEGGAIFASVARPSWQGLNLGVLFSAKGQVRINVCAMAGPISRRLRSGITADVLSG